MREPREQQAGSAFPQVCPACVQQRWVRVLAAARGALPWGGRGPHPLRVCNPCLCPPDEKEESILGSIPLLSFRVAAVQPSDNISRKHTFKVSAGLCWGLQGMGVMLTGSPLLLFLLGGGAWGKLGRG